MHLPAQGAQNSCHHFHCVCLHIRSSHGSVALHFFQCTGICFQQRVVTAASDRVMGIRLPSKIHNAKQILKLQSLLSRNQSSVPKGHCAVYVGEIQKKRFVVPISYLNHPAFQDLLHLAEEEFGFDHPMGGLTIPCEEDAFIDLTSRLNAMSVM
eukprot:XP_019073763.1 PREDICTED: auxin-responsive protein SAUR21 isoform X1 [Vitis vinifera]